MTADNQLVHWGRASINWTPHGYDLLVEASVFGKRAADILLRELQASTEEWDMRWHVSPGEIERTSAGSTAHFTLIELHSPKLFALDPDHLRAAIGDAAATAVKEAGEEEARDNQLAAEFLRKLRGD